MNRFLKKSKAASILGVSSRTIFRYLEKGLLVPAYCGSGIGVWEEDVLKLKKLREQDAPTAMDRELVMRLLAEVETLKSQMSTVLRILNIKFDPLNLTTPEYRSLHRMAELYSNEGWPPQAEQQWADTFVRLRIDDLEEMKDASGDEHPWICLLKLVTTMHLNAYDKSLQDQLASGKANVHSVAGTWCILKGKTAAEFALITRREGAPNRRLVRKLGKTRRAQEAVPTTLPLGEGANQESPRG
jgi:DNA-binding transcriptional MerR regulator